MFLFPSLGDRDGDEDGDGDGDEGDNDAGDDGSGNDDNFDNDNDGLILAAVPFLAMKLADRERDPGGNIPGTKHNGLA